MTAANPIRAQPQEDSPPQPARTPLHDLHLRLGAKMVPFADYALPLHYRAGVLGEHLHTRAAASIFDVSHMGQICLVPDEPGTLADVALWLEGLLPIDVVGLPPGRQRYGFLTDAHGGILDDLVVGWIGTRLVLVVNAASKAADAARLRAHVPPCSTDMLSNALIALQGPAAAAALARLAPSVVEMRFMDVREVDILGASCVVSRSGYTGEDGFEISIPPERAEAVAEALLHDPSVQPAGLGARDSLRLEAGLCLHGSDLDATINPVEAALTWAIAPVRRNGGARAGGFPGAERILHDIAAGPARTRVGLRPEGRTPVRAGAALFVREDDSEPCGRVTSGGFGPSLQAPVAMGYVPARCAAPSERIFADVRGRRLPLTVTSLPFVPARYKRR